MPETMSGEERLELDAMVGSQVFDFDVVGKVRATVYPNGDVNIEALRPGGGITHMESYRMAYVDRCICDHREERGWGDDQLICTKP